MRISDRNKLLSQEYCDKRGCELLGRRRDGFVYREPSGNTKAMSYSAAAAVLGKDFAPTNHVAETKLTQPQQMLIAILGDLNPLNLSKYPFVKDETGNIIFSIPAYEVICKPLDENHFSMEAYYLNSDDGIKHLSVKRERMSYKWPKLQCKS